MFTNEELLQMVKDHKNLNQDQLNQLLKSGLLEPVEADWVSKKPSYSSLADEIGLDDGDGEPIEPN